MESSRTRRIAAAVALLAMLLLVLLPAAGRIATGSASVAPHTLHPAAEDAPDGGEPFAADDCAYCPVQAGADLPLPVRVALASNASVEPVRPPRYAQAAVAALQGLGARGPPATPSA